MHLRVQACGSPECPIPVIGPDSYESDRQVSVSVTSEVTNESAAWLKKKGREEHVFRDYIENKRKWKAVFHLLCLPLGSQAFGDTPCCEDRAVALPDEVMGHHLSPHYDNLHLEASVHL